jgi:hypothetical protein
VLERAEEHVAAEPRVAERVDREPAAGVEDDVEVAGLDAPQAAVAADARARVRRRGRGRRRRRRRNPEPLLERGELGQHRRPPRLGDVGAEVGGPQRAQLPPRGGVVRAAD